MFEYSSDAVYKGCVLFPLGCYSFLAKLEPSSFLGFSSCEFTDTCLSHPEVLLCSPNQNKGCAQIAVL